MTTHNTSDYVLLTHLNDHMNKNPSYPGDWHKLFYNYINNREYNSNRLQLLDNDLLNDYKFEDIDDMILKIGKAIRNVDQTWCKENIIGFTHSETTQNISLSKSPYVYNENIKPFEFWKRFVYQMLIYRYG